MCQPISNFTVRQRRLAQSFQAIDALIEVINDVKAVSHEAYILLLEILVDCPTLASYNSVGLPRLQMLRYNDVLSRMTDRIAEVIVHALSDETGESQGQIHEWMTEEYGNSFFQKTCGIAYTRYRKANFWDDVCNEYIDVEPQKGSRDLDLVIESGDRRKCAGFEMKVSVQNFLTDHPRKTERNKLRYMQLLIELLSPFGFAVYLVSARGFVLYTRS